MIDTHCHLLPALDDGPRDSAAAVHLGRQLARAGITTVICTPHFSRRYPTDVQLARTRLIELLSAFHEADVPLRLQLAAEVSPARLASSPGEELAARSIGGFVLVELEPGTPSAFVETAVDRLSRHGLRPIFAHPERSTSIRAQPRLLDEARAEGALIQIVASSLTRRFGARTEAAGWRLLEAGSIDLLASDAHRARREGTHFEHATKAVDERLGREVLDRLTRHNPALILDAAARTA